MSKYPTLEIGPLGFATLSDALDPDILMLFRPSDLRARKIDGRDNAALLNHVLEGDLDFYDADNPLVCVQYRCSTAAARDRLDLKGFTIKAAERAFNEGLVGAIHGLEELKLKAEALSEYLDERLSVARSLTFKSWLAALERIREENITSKTLNCMSSSDSQLPILHYMLSWPTSFYGFPSADARHFVRLATDSASNTDEVVYDLTPLLVRERYEDEDAVAADAEYLMQQDFLLEHRVIVLTEGKSDMEFLGRSLKILYPHLTDYFHFFDFTRESAEGGVGQLVKLIRAFANADVRHRILAICDNDTAAKESLSNLESSNLPDNIVFAQYPTIPIARAYPTMGPSGKTVMDINGLAGSLEIYLGQDVLEDDDGQLRPVQWKGYSQKMKAYQGEVRDKQIVQSRFRRKLEHCEAHPTDIESYDWHGMHEIIRTMRSAFHDVDLKAILNDSSQF